jgi:hypothetical protein
MAKPVGLDKTLTSLWLLGYLPLNLPPDLARQQHSIIALIASIQS